MSVWPRLFSSHVHVIIAYTILYLNLSTNLSSPGPFKTSYFDTHSPIFRSVTGGFEGYPPASLISLQRQRSTEAKLFRNKFLSLQEEQAWPWPWHGKKEGEHGAKHPDYVIYYI